MPQAHTRTPSSLSQSSISSTRLATQPVARRPSLAHQPSLPLLGETAVLSPLPFPNSIVSRSRSHSAASLSSQHVPSAIQFTQSSPLPATAAPTRRQSSQSRFTSISSTLSFSSAHPSESSIRNAVYFDSQEVKYRLDSLLAATATSPPTLGHTDDDVQEIEIGRMNPHSFTLMGSNGVPPNTPTTAYYQTPYASSSQIYLGTSSSSQSLESSPILADAAPIRPSAAPPLIVDSSSDECAAHGGELSTPGTSPAISSLDKDYGPYGYEGAYYDELGMQEHGLAPPTSSRWSLTSSTLDLSSPEGARGNRKSILGAASKLGKRGRLASFISRLSGIPPQGSVTGTWEPMPPTPSKEWTSITPTKGLHLDDGVPPTLTDDDTDDEPMVWPRDTQSRKERLSIVTTRLDRDFNSDGRLRRISLSHPSSPQVSPISARDTINGRHRLKSMSSLGSLTAVAKSQRSGFRGLAARMGLAPSMPPPLEAGWGKTNKKRKLVISGLNEADAAGYEAVRSWCEVGNNRSSPTAILKNFQGFGEVRHMKRKPNGCLHVDFRKASVAETVSSSPRIHPLLQCFLDEVLILVRLGVSPAGSGEYQGRRKCFSFLVYQERDALGSALSRDFKIQIKPSKLSKPTSSTSHCHTLSTSSSSSTCYLILDLCAYLCNLAVLTNFSRYTYLDFSRFAPSLAQSCPCPASSPPGNIHSRLYCRPALRNTKHHLHKSAM